jgi:hypothetical protein
MFMKRIIVVTFFVLVAVGGFGVRDVFGQEINCKNPNELRRQIPLNVKIPFIGRPCCEQVLPDGRVITAENSCVYEGLSEYVASLYMFLIGIAGMLALFAVVNAGFNWLTAMGSADKISKAKSAITGALTGLFIALFSYALLQTINPQLLTLPTFRIEPELAREQKYTVARKVCPPEMNIKCGSTGIVTPGGKNKYVTTDNKPEFCMGSVCDFYYISSNSMCGIAADESGNLIGGGCRASISMQVDEDTPGQWPNSFSVSRNTNCGMVIGNNYQKSPLDFNINGSLGSKCSNDQPGTTSCYFLGIPVFDPSNEIIAIDTYGHEALVLSLSTTYQGRPGFFCAGGRDNQWK